MKFWKPFLLVLWIAGILVLLIFYIIPQEEALNNDTIQKLEKENELLTVKNVSLDEEIKKLKKQTDSLTGRIVLSHKTIQNLQNALDEKINTIDRMSALDLYEYFSGFTADSTRLKQ
jgi:peptidoglycan hydrolase CwlO-like protein